ncbi:MAG TPA: diphthine synthase [Thermoplasmata archaeon]|nr:diphthine synthase [Thermoplasmata archaeon]
MSVLWFVGLGLDDERGLSRRAVEVLRACEVFAEEYTAVAAPGSVERLGRELGRPVTRLGRAEVEGETAVLAALERSGQVALLVVGDPFAATTHVALRLAAENAGHSWSYLPNASILVAAAGFLGLSQYRFGRTVSLPFPAPGFEPRSPLEQIGANREHDLHTLVLLDLAPDAGRFLRAEEALAILRERDRPPTVVREDDLLAVAARVGRDDAAGFFGTFRALQGIAFGPPLHALVVPARRLHFQEAAALERFRVGPPG